MGGEVLLLGRDTGIADQQRIHDFSLLVTVVTNLRLLWPERESTIVREGVCSRPEEAGTACGTHPDEPPG